ncbi:MAG TPA: DUF1592 domain-containing protein [Polyangia bacterium]|nr:DUF1592 domain-containing protein [Polyangia bacterium]
MSRSTTVAAACLSLTLACSGEIGDAAPSGQPGGIKPGGGQQSGPTVSTPLTCSDSVTDVDATPLRRLTNAEYLNTVSDLLGDISSLNLDFAVELTTENFPFLDNAAAQETPPQLASQYLSAAEKIAADTVANRLSKVLMCDPAAVGEQACAQTFISSFATKAFRRPVDADQTTALLSVWQVGRDTGGNFNSGVEAVITAVLQMPEFLYRFELSPPVAGKSLIPLDGWDMATRLSYLLWNSGPDGVLLAAAQAGKLQTPADISAQVTRMLGQPRAHEMVLRFHDQWLQLDAINSLEKDPMEFPKFSLAVAAAMQQEVRSLVDDVVFQGDGKVAGLFTAPYTFLNDALGTFYGIKGQSPTFARVDQAALGMRPASGILTAGGLLAANANRNLTSPTKRGIFVREALLCETLPPPPPNANITPPVAQPNQTRRQAMINHVTDPTCAACHVMMDQIGFGFEGFDASGAWRTIDNGQPVDASGNVIASDVAGTFNGPVELGAKLATSDEAVSCAATQWFRFAFGRDSGKTTGDTCAVTQLHDALKQGGQLALVRAIPLTAPFLYRKVPQGGL